MIEERVFDGTIGREGIDILAEICKNGLAIWYFWGLWGSYELYSLLAKHDVMPEESTVTR
jgi:hypothetical protein